MNDSVDDLAHDHADINRRVLDLGALLRLLEREGAGARALVAPLTELRDSIFLHFAREEEGLFPFAAEHVPELAPQVHDMALAHDLICGALARMVHLASTGGQLATIAPVFERFELSYATHASTEVRTLEALDAKLAPAQRVALTALIAGL